MRYRLMAVALSALVASGAGAQGNPADTMPTIRLERKTPGPVHKPSPAKKSPAKSGNTDQTKASPGMSTTVDTQVVKGEISLNMKFPEEMSARSGVTRPEPGFQCQLANGQVVTFVNQTDCSKVPPPTLTTTDTQERGWWGRNWKSVAVTGGIVGATAVLIWGRLVNNSSNATVIMGTP